MQDYSKLLWCDLKTDTEKAEFLRCGRAVETGIVAPALVPELVEVFEFRSKHRAVSLVEFLWRRSEQKSLS